MPATVLGNVEINDDRIDRHLRHHERYAQPSPSGRWTFTLLRLPLAELYCPYDDPGVRDVTNRAGLMGSIGLSRTGYAGTRVVDLAMHIETALAAGRADLTNPALECVLKYRDLGTGHIYSQDQPLAIFQWDGRWAVREGIHRSVALALLGQATIEALDFNSGTVRC